jgi:hypothetical protein
MIAPPRPRLWIRSPGSHTPAPGRRTIAAGRVLGALLVCFLLWGLLDARSLKQSAEASPLGIRRSTALVVLRPLARISAGLGIDWLGRNIERALGGNPNAPPGGAPLGGPGGVDMGSSQPPAGGNPLPGPPPGTEPEVPPESSPTPKAPTVVVGPARLPPLRRPTKAAPLRVLVLGDSLAAELGQALQRRLGPELFRVTVDGRISTGLARSDYFNWPAEVHADVVRYRPELVVAMFGANDNQSIYLGRGRWAYWWQRAAWLRAYHARVSQIMRVGAAGGARVAWVGIPITQSSAIPWYKASLFDSVYRGEAPKLPGVLYYDSWHLFVNESGKFSPFLPDQKGHFQLMRMPDGVHMTPAGNDYLVVNLLGALRTTWNLHVQV